MVKLPEDKTEVYMTYVAAVCTIFTMLYIYLVVIVKEKDVPVFIPTTIASSLGCILYTLKPKSIG